MRRSGSTPSTTQTELTQALYVDPELGTAPRTTAPIMMRKPGVSEPAELQEFVQPPPPTPCDTIENWRITSIQEPNRQFR